MKKGDDKMWLAISAILLILAVFIPPQSNSVLKAIAPGLVENQIYRWALPTFFLFATCHFLIKIIKDKTKNKRRSK